MSVKQAKASKLLSDLYIVNSSNFEFDKLWHHRQRRWVQADQRILSAITLFPHRWSVDAVVVSAPGEGEADITVETYVSNLPELHENLVDELNKHHAKLILESPNIIAVGWVARVTDRVPSPRLLMQLLGIWD